MSAVTDYLHTFTGETRSRLVLLCEMVLASCPQSVESFSYGMVGYKLNGHPLIYFGGFKNHIGVYATPAGQETFVAELAPYKQGKGSVQFPLIEPLPSELISRIIDARVSQVSELLPVIGSPATHALAELGVVSSADVAAYSEQELLAIHGVGPKAVRILKEAGILLRAI